MIFCKRGLCFFGLFILIAFTMAQNPVANFSANKLSGCPPLTVQFNNTSQNSVSYSWSFGDGNTSSLANPSNVFINSGNYVVMLVAYNSGGITDTLFSSDTIVVLPSPKAGFSASDTTFCNPGIPINFTDLSTNANSWLWDFGNGGISQVKNPAFIYSVPGSYSVTLLAGNDNGCTDNLAKTGYIIINKPVVVLTVDSLLSCNQNHSFLFDGQGSQNVSQFQWGFGDGGTSALPAPSHLYSSPGTYSVSLNVSNFFGCSATGNLTVTVGKPVLNVTSSTDTGCVQANISFSCNSPGLASWQWNFGDGGTSVVNNPTYSYSSTGIFDVSLSAVSSIGCISDTFLNNFITIQDNSNAGFTLNPTSGCGPLTVQFTNTSANSTKWLWEFGDGSTDSIKNPSHVFTLGGNYTVKLTCSGPNVCTSVFSIVNAVAVLGPNANFVSDLQGGCPPLTVNFSDLSANATQWKWDFGDGTTSSLQSPSHLYDTSGIFNVRLIALNNNGCSDTILINNYIQIVSVNPEYETPDPISGCIPLTVNFNDNTPGAIAWHWNFGDGDSSTLSNPIHQYSQNGLDTVSLIVDLAFGCSKKIPIYNVFDVKGNFPGFTGVVTSCNPLTAQFTDTSTNALTWLWDFGDGTSDTVPNPLHVYSSNDYYSVALTITTPDGCEIKTISYNFLAFPEFAAVVCPSKIDSDTTIIFFTAALIGNLDSIYWDFGLGIHATTDTFTVDYPGPGPYQVTLSLYSGGCTKEIVLSTDDSCVVNNTPVLFFPEPDTSVSYQGCNPILVNFYNPYPEIFTDFFWNFGDGTTSNLYSPSHVYLYPGVYDVTLIASSNDTSAIISFVNLATQPPSYEYFFNPDTTFEPAFVKSFGTSANFSYAVFGNCDSLKYFFYDNSPSSYQWTWDFGDLDSAFVPNPIHSYPLKDFQYLISEKIVDTNNCSNVAINSINITIQEPYYIYQNNVCTGDSVAFNSNLFGFSGYAWNFGDGTTDSSILPFHVYDSVGVFVVSITTIDSVGCLRTDTLPNPMVVSKTPTAAFSLSNDFGCNKLSATLSNQSSGNTSLQWNFGDGSFSTDTAPSHTWNSPGIYIVTLQAQNSTCMNLISDTVFVDSVKADFSFQQSSLCFPILATFTDTSTNAVSWLWSFGDGGSDTLQNPTHNYDTIPANGVKLVVTNPNGCKDSIIKPGINFGYTNIQESAGSGCVPLTITFNAVSPSAISWQWDFGDGNFSTQQSPVHTFTDSGTYNIILIVQTSNNCPDTQTTTVFAKLVQADFYNPSPPGCEPHLVLFTDSSVNAVAWQWDLGDSTFSSISSPGHIYSQGNFTVSLVVTDIFGCKDTVIKNNYINVPGPNADYSTLDTGCTQSPIQFNNLSEEEISWNWNFGDGNNSSVESPVHSFDLPGSYFVTLEVFDSLGCQSSFTGPPMAIFQSPPFPGVVVSEKEGCMPLFILANDTISSPSDVEFLWNFGDGSTSTDINPDHSYSTSGSFPLTMEITSLANGCKVLSDTSIILVHPLPLPECTVNPKEEDTRNPNFSFSVNSAVKYIWNFGDGDSSFIQSPVHIFSDTGTHKVTVAVFNEFNCSQNCSVEFNLRPYYEITVPNAFTPSPDAPNGGMYSLEDFSNNVFFPVTRFVTSFHMLIFNRWGELVFESTDINIGWDGYYRGKISEQDVYAWKMEVEFDFRETRKLAGNVTLVR